MRSSVSHAQDFPTVKELGVKADYALKQGDIYTALEIYVQAAQKEPNNFQVLFRLGELQMETRDYAAAHRTFKEVYEKKPDYFPLAQYYYGLMGKRVGAYETALDLLNGFSKEYRGPDYYIYKKSAKSEAEGAKLALDMLNQSSIYTVAHPGAGINTAYTDFSPVYVNENQMIYAALMADSVISFGASKSAKKLSYRARFYSAERANDTWTTKGELEGPFNINTAETGNGAFSRDGQRFYFTRCNLNNEHRMICEIYRSERKQGGWSAPEKLPENINMPGYTTTHPFVAALPKKDGDLLYFVSDRPQGKGGLDIWSTDYDAKKGKWEQQPQNLGTRVNTTADEMTPFLDSLFGYLYFSSDGWPTVGGLDIFKAKEAEGKFRSYPENLGFPVNSGADDIYYSIDYKTNKGFIVSNRIGSISLKSPTCCDDIFEITLDRSLVFGLDGYVYYKQETDTTGNKLILPGATVSFFRAGSDIPVGESESDKNGFFFFPLNPESDYYITVGKKGYFSFKSDVITTKGLLKSDTLHQPAIVLLPITKKAVRVENIYYEFDSDKLTDSSQAVLDSTVYRIMVANPLVILEIGSHTDNRGTHDYNVSLSSKRAQSVVRYLIEKGISKDRLQAKGYAEMEPVAPNTHPDGSDNPDGRAKNRRTEFKVIGTIEVDPDEISLYED